MNEHVQALLTEWEFVRRCSTEFIRQFSDQDLDRKLPRRGLDTFRKHFQEMTMVQEDYVAAIRSGVMKFNGVADSQLSGDWSKEKLLAAMAEADAGLVEAAKRAGDGAQIKWFGEERPLTAHLAGLVSHEMMHVGQIVAFCYALDIEIPKFVQSNWALSG